jgi:hypothetical protein
MFFANTPLFRIIRLFKFELIKVIVFLLLFGATLFVVNTESEQYYNGSKDESIDK